jgi:hypothetical protein
MPDVLLYLLRRLELRLLGDPPDPYWKAQTPDQRFTGFDRKLSAAGTARAFSKFPRAGAMGHGRRGRGPRRSPR